MGENNKNTTASQWKEALAICQSFENLSIQQIRARIDSLSLEKNIRDKVIKLLSKTNENHSFIDNQDITTVMGEIDRSDKLIGEKIDSYKIISLIAKGGMSVVYKAEYIKSGIHKAVALKILSPYVFSNKSIELFKREQLILSKLEHPNIISFHHSGKTRDDTRYLIMEYIDGAQTITDYCKNNDFSDKQIVKYMIQLAKVFAYTHSKSIIHRDIQTH